VVIILVNFIKWPTLIDGKLGLVDCAAIGNVAWLNKRPQSKQHADGFAWKCDSAGEKNSKRESGMGRGRI